MKIVKVDDEIIEKLDQSGLLKEMKNLQNCDFLAVIEYDGKIIGAGGIGGFFNNSLLQVHPNFQNRGLGVKLFSAILDEARKRNYSFVFGTRDNKNKNVKKIHDFYRLRSIFQIKYSREFTREILILALNKRGKIVENFLRGFNNFVGMLLLVVFLKVFRNFFLKGVGSMIEESSIGSKNSPSLDIIYALRNFEKI